MMHGPAGSYLRRRLTVHRDGLKVETMEEAEERKICCRPEATKERSREFRASVTGAQTRTARPGLAPT